MRPRTRPTITDVARMARVSPTTVSYVLSGRQERAARISQETTSRVLDAVSEVGYVPNHSARTLRLRRTDCVVFLGSRLTSLYSQAMARSIEQRLERHGLALSVGVSSDLAGIQQAVSMLEQSQADGLIVETSDDYVSELRDAAARGHAIVAIGPSNPEPLFDVISVDDEPAVADAMLHVVGRGYRQFLLLSSLPTPLQERRVSVAHQNLLSLGIPKSRITLLHCPHDRMSAHALAVNTLPQMSRPLGVYAGADVSAIGVLWACHRLGLAVPEHVAIIGHGNSRETHVTVPSLTSVGTVSSDFSNAADLMASRLKDRSLPGRYLTEPCQLTIRESS